MKQNLEVKIGKLKLKNPVMVASGTFGEEYEEITDINSLGAYVAKTITLKARTGNPPPRIAETPSGMLNSIGLENKGLEYFIKEKVPFLKKLKVPVIVSIAGGDEEEFKTLARKLGKIPEVSAIELNLSCPNIRYGLRETLIAQDAALTGAVVKAVRSATGLTIITKLSPNVTDIASIAKAAEDAGSDAVLAVNTFLGTAIDIETARPKLGNVTGGLSGPAIKPLAVRAVWNIYKSVKIPVIGAGGIMDYKDAVEFILAGASAIQVGTANFVDPNTCIKIINGIEKYMAGHNVERIKDLTGAANGET